MFNVNLNRALHNATPPTPSHRYRHDPYALDGRRFYDENNHSYSVTPQSGASHAQFPGLGDAPAGTRHGSLWGAVTFIPYPTEEFEPPVSPPTQQDGELVRVFIGQLPYFVTDMQLSWLCYTFGFGHLVAHPERIMKRQPNGERLPTGCIHAYATVQAVEEMAAGMHKRMLVDDTGVWHAQTAAEFEVLTDYISAMKTDKSMRIPNRPYDSVVIQLATSTYVPRHVASKPHLALNAVNDVADVVAQAPRSSYRGTANASKSRFQ